MASSANFKFKIHISSFEAICGSRPPDKSPFERGVRRLGPGAMIFFCHSSYDAPAYDKTDFTCKKKKHHDEHSRVELGHVRFGTSWISMMAPGVPCFALYLGHQTWGKAFSMTSSANFKFEHSYLFV